MEERTATTYDELFRLLNVRIIAYCDDRYFTGKTHGNWVAYVEENGEKYWLSWVCASGCLLCDALARINSSIFEEKRLHEYVRLFVWLKRTSRFDRLGVLTDLRKGRGIEDWINILITFVKQQPKGA